MIGTPFNIPTGNTLWVDALNGNDASGVRGRQDKPFLTLGAAKASAIIGDLIYVLPGSYTPTDSILKNGVNWYFEVGSVVSMTVTTGAGPTTLLDDKGVAISCNIFGEADFSVVLNGSQDYTGCVHVNNASTNLVIEARSISATQGISLLGIPIAIFGQNGILRVRCSHSIFATDLSVDSGIAIYWKQGLNVIEAPSIWATNNSVWTDTIGSASDNMYIRCSEMYTTGGNVAQPGVITSFDGSNVNAAIWITADTVKASVGSNYCSVWADSNNSNKIYLQCQKMFGDVRCGGGLCYVTSTKVEAISNVTGGVVALFASCSGGTLRYNVLQHDPKSFTGIAFLINGGTLISNAIEYTSSSGSLGLSISSGTARLQTPYINTVANNATNPITTSGGTLILMAATLVAEGSRDSVTAATAQNIIAMSSWANKAVNVNVTNLITLGLSVDSDVA